MRENIYFWPSSQIQSRTVWQKFKTGPCQIGSALPLEPDFQLILQSVQKTNIGGGIVPLGLAQFWVTPIAGLLLLRNILTKKFADKFLQSMAVGISPNKPGRDLRAENWFCHDAQIMIDGGEVKAGKMIKFQAILIGQDRSEVWSSIITLRTEADEMLIAVAVRNLKQTQTVTMGLKSHGFRVHRNGTIG